MFHSNAKERYFLALSLWIVCVATPGAVEVIRWLPTSYSTALCLVPWAGRVRVAGGLWAPRTSLSPPESQPCLHVGAGRSAQVLLLTRQALLPTEPSPDSLIHRDRTSEDETRAGGQGRQTGHTEHVQVPQHVHRLPQYKHSVSVSSHD